MSAASSKVRLEGWLSKKKSGEKITALFKQDNQRWFRLQELGGPGLPELALCYYNSRKDTEAKGWIYIKDIQEVRDEKKSFIVFSQARTMTLEAQSQAEHVLWIQTLTNCMTGSGKLSIETSSKSNNPESKYADEDKRSGSTPRNQPSNPDPKGNGKGYDEGRRRGSGSSYDREDRPRTVSFSDERPQVRGGRISRGASEDGDDNNSYPSKSALAREDHRLQYAHGDSSGTVSGRLNKYIAGDRPARRDDGVEEVDLDDVPQNRSRAVLTKKAQRRQNERGRGSNSDEESGQETGSDRDDHDNKHHSSDDDSKPAAERPSHKEEDAKETTTTRMPGGRPPPPTAAPPRRAKDALAELETQRARRSIDDVLFRKDMGESKTSNDETKTENDSKPANDDSEDESFDLKSEMRKYGTGESENHSRPPRPAGKSSLQVQSSTAVRRSPPGGPRIGTPPRPGGNPGNDVDDNFATDNWDEDGDNGPKHTTPVKSAGVKEDSNWLNEDFDN